MPRKRMVRGEAGVRLTDLITLGALTRCVPPGRVRACLEQTKRTSQRVRDLPAQVMVYYVMALGLYRGEETREVLRLLLEGLKQVLGLAVGVKVASRSAISQARSRLGEAPVKALYEGVVGPIATEQTRGAFYRQWRVVALDGTTLETPDTEANVEGFGRPASEQGQAAWPRLRVVGLVETGTHVLFGAVLGRFSEGEVTLAKPVLKHLRAGMLCLADRAFPGLMLWREAAASGAELVWRVRQKVNLPCEARLADGSYLSHMYGKWERGRGRGECVAVRVIDYEVRDATGKVTSYRLITTILDPEAAPAQELAELYHERWEFETTLDEFKTHLRGARTVLRSQSPEMIRQECYGLLLAHFALRALMHEAALIVDRDPDRLSFIHTVRVVRRSLPRFAALPPSDLDAPASARPERDPGGRRRRTQGAAREAGSQAQTEPLPRPTTL
jgi:hypothetical protein